MCSSGEACPRGQAAGVIFQRVRCLWAAAIALSSRLRFSSGRTILRPAVGRAASCRCCLRARGKVSAGRCDVMGPQSSHAKCAPEARQLRLHMSNLRSERRVLRKGTRLSEHQAQQLLATGSVNLLSVRRPEQRRAGCWAAVGGAVRAAATARLGQRHSRTEAAGRRRECDTNFLPPAAPLNQNPAQKQQRQAPGVPPASLTHMARAAPRPPRAWQRRVPQALRRWGEHDAAAATAPRGRTRARRRSLAR